MTTMNIAYRFELENNISKEFVVGIQRPDLIIKLPDLNNMPEWTELKCHKCENCPLNENDYSHCPAAVSLIDVIKFFGELKSYSAVETVVTTDQRQFKKKADIQTTVSSLIGLYMASSGCPMLAFLRPLLFIHLPFSSMDETMFRVISMYLMGQFFLKQRGEDPDWKLEKLEKSYEELRKVNLGFTDRLRTLNLEDGALNAIMNLDCFAMNTSFSIAANSLEEIENCFRSYFPK